jgi:hypothetical protein
MSEPTKYVINGEAFYVNAMTLARVVNQRNQLLAALKRALDEGCLDLRGVREAAIASVEGQS